MSYKYCLSAGISVPNIYELVKCDNKIGLIMDYIHGYSLYSIFEKNVSFTHMPTPNYINNNMSITSKYAKFIKNLHQIDIRNYSNLSLDNSFEKELSKKIVTVDNLLEEQYKGKIYSIIQNINEDYTIIHGDPQPANIMVNNNSLFFIDLELLSLGKPIYDLGAIHRTLFLPLNVVYEKYCLSKEYKKIFWKKFIDEYYSGSSKKYIEKKEYEAKLISCILQIHIFINKADNLNNKQMLHNLFTNLKDIIKWFYC